ncbi:hypothetical protein ABFS82_02G013500 [Erythranthe guttata]|uniref:protein COBRA-like n=1 Tax=Erythranthe guttata TaxID=4155 RepID=UPI00064DEA44|nr:PREDICTED: protein COBRA-like [Erythranthe guttata]|eukprot:XP_012837135.1 PREDICTED: protein COBRA-like [Erythranthe guttata]
MKSMRIWNFAIIFLISVLSLGNFVSIDACFASFGPMGNVTIEWDVTNWTTDGYIANVTIYNFQNHQKIDPTGWEFGWRWKRDEVITSMVGGQTREQGNCSSFEKNIPQSCVKNPTVSNKFGVSNISRPNNEVVAASLQINVGRAGTSRENVRVPSTHTLKTPGVVYNCGPATVVRLARITTPDGKHVTRAIKTWRVVCTRSIFVAHRISTFCARISSPDVRHVTCSCGCTNNARPGSCVELDSPVIRSIVSITGNDSSTPLVECRSRMCPARVLWHVKLNDQEKWDLVVSLRDLNRVTKNRQWNVFAEHPDFHNVTKIFTLNYNYLTPHGHSEDVVVLWASKSYPDSVEQGDALDNVHLGERVQQSNFYLL